MPRLFVLHLRAWFSKWSEQRRARELRGLLDGIQEQLIREQHAFAFHLLAGDFNALAPGERLDPSPMPAWIRGMIWLSGRDIARSTIEMMQADGYVDAWRTIHADPDVEPGYTFPVWEPHVRLDYVFTPSAYASRMNAVRGAADAGGDAVGVGSLSAARRDRRVVSCQIPRCAAGERLQLQRRT